MSAYSECFCGQSNMKKRVMISEPWQSACWKRGSLI